MTDKDALEEKRKHGVLYRIQYEIKKHEGKNQCFTPRMNLTLGDLDIICRALQERQSMDKIREQAEISDLMKHSNAKKPSGE